MRPLRIKCSAFDLRDMALQVYQVVEQASQLPVERTLDPAQLPDAFARRS